MSDIGALVERLIERGFSIGEASSIIAGAVAAGAASVSARSSNAVRQQRYRDRKRNETVTNRNVVTPDPSVTNRNETVTNRNDVTAPSISLDKDSKKKDRGSQLCDGWKPDSSRWNAACLRLGPSSAGRELEKFTSHHRAKGTVFKNWNFAWDKWLVNAQQWAPKQAAGVGVVDPEGVNWRAALESYKKFNNWPRGHGNDPTSPACRAPPELLREYGFAPIPSLKSA